jgi:C-terminal processing protease CtpA/Prc
VYVGYNQVQASDPPTLSLTQFSRDLAAAIEAGTADRIVVDVRNNPGGNNGTYGPLLGVLAEQATVKPGSVVILIGRSTFSAAANFVTELRAVEGVTFLGEPTGGAPNLFGDATIVTLPASGLRVHIATREWTFAPGSDALAIEPDVLIPVRWSDVAVGRDPALEIALEGR